MGFQRAAGLKHTAEESDEADATDFLARTVYEPENIGPIGFTSFANRVRSVIANNDINASIRRCRINRIVERNGEQWFAASFQA